MATAPIVFLGMATQDFVSVVPHLPAADEVIEAQHVGVHGGGPAATAAVACARLGGSAEFIGAVGADAIGSGIAAELEREGVEVARLQAVEGGSSPAAVILVDAPTGRRSILYTKGSGTELEYTPEIGAAVRGAALLHLDGYHIEPALRAAAVAREAGVLVSLDGGAGQLWPRMEELAALADLLVVARDFAHRLTGEDDPLLAASQLLQFGSAQEVVVTDGANGAWYLTRANSGHVPAFAVGVVDTTGAGDVFHGAYALARAEGLDVPAAVRMASAAAALKCRQSGGRRGIPTRQELEEFLADAG